MTASTNVRPLGDDDREETLKECQQRIREATDFDAMRGLLGELPPGIFPPRSNRTFFRRRHRE